MHACARGLENDDLQDDIDLEVNQAYRLLTYMHNTGGTRRN